LIVLIMLTQKLLAEAADSLRNTNASTSGPTYSNRKICTTYLIDIGVVRSFFIRWGNGKPLKLRKKSRVG